MKSFALANRIQICEQNHDEGYADGNPAPYVLSHLTKHLKIKDGKKRDWNQGDHQIYVALFDQGVLHCVAD